MAGVKRTTGTGVNIGTGASFDLSTGIQGIISNPNAGSIPVSRNIAPAEHSPANNLEMLFSGLNLSKQIDRMLAPAIQNRSLLQADVFPRHYLSALRFLIHKNEDSNDDDDEEKKRSSDLEELYEEFEGNHNLYKMLSGLLIAG